MSVLGLALAVVMSPEAANITPVVAARSNVHLAHFNYPPPCWRGRHPTAEVESAHPRIPVKVTRRGACHPSVERTLPAMSKAAATPRALDEVGLTSSDSRWVRYSGATLRMPRLAGRSLIILMWNGCTPWRKCRSTASRAAENAASRAAEDGRADRQRKRLSPLSD
jgi:hypothetical protein